MGGSTTTTQTADPWQPTQAGLKTGIAAAGDLYANGGFNIDPYAGDMVANMNAGTSDAINSVLGSTQGNVSAINGALGVAQDVAGTNSDAIRANVLQNIMPSINSSFAGSGMTGSSLHAQNLAKGVTSGMADAEMAINSQRLQAAGMVPSLAQASLQPYQSAISAGQMLQAQEQAEIDANVQQDIMGQGADMTALQNYMALLSGIGGQFGTQTGTQSSSPGFGQVAGGILQGLSLFSDPRLKRDIKRVGALDDGTPVYTYQYVDEAAPAGMRGVTVMGVMSTEVGHLGAVMPDPSGFDRVNYGAL